MKLLATLDYWDGRPGKTKECDLEDVTGSAVIGSLMNRGVASITFTRPPDLLKITTKEPQP